MGKWRVSSCILAQYFSYYDFLINYLIRYKINAIQFLIISIKWKKRSYSTRGICLMSIIFNESWYLLCWTALLYFFSYNSKANSLTFLLKLFAYYWNIILSSKSLFLFSWDLPIRQFSQDAQWYFYPVVLISVALSPTTMNWLQTRTNLRYITETISKQLGDINAHLKAWQPKVNSVSLMQ